MEFKKVKLQDIVTILGDGIHGTPKYTENGEYYFINGNNLANGKIIIKSDTKTVDYEEYKKYKKDLNDRTLLVSINGTLGNVAVYNGEKCILGKSACYFNIKENVDKQYIQYILYSKEFQKYIQDYATGTTIKNMSLKAMREYEFILPEIEVQNKITKILSGIDKKIELNNQINDNLLNLGINKIINEDYIEMVQLKTLTKLISKGTTPTGSDTKKYPNKDIKFIKVKDFNEYGVDEKNIEFISNEIHTGKLKRSILLRDDLLVSIAGTLGKIATVTKSLNNANTNQAVAFVRLEKTINKGYLYFFMNTKDFQEDIIRKQVHAVQPNLSLTELGNIVVPVISNENKILYNGLLEKIILNIEENKRLEQLRDALLPKLMNGEIDLDKIEI